MGKSVHVDPDSSKRDMSGASDCSVTSTADSRLIPDWLGPQLLPRYTPTALTTGSMAVPDPTHGFFDYSLGDIGQFALFRLAQI